jgi:hypothetical protein
MVRDPRGGHNRYKINENFFKIWSSSMAYVLGYIYADGSLINAHRSSRTKYLAITSKDASILYKINRALGCNKPLYRRPPRVIKYPSGKTYTNSLTYTLRIGNMVIFNDLMKLGLTPRKSLSLKLPRIPFRYFAHFLRGYFDGDGCFMLSRPPKRNAHHVRVVFSSGSRQFLNDLAGSISKSTEIQEKHIYQQTRSFNLTYFKATSLKILRFMYSEIEKDGLYLDRKYGRYLSLLKTEVNRPRNLTF